MPKINLHVPEEMERALKEHSEETGIPVSEFVRRAIARELRRSGKPVTWKMSWGGVRDVSVKDDELTEGQQVAVA